MNKKKFTKLLALYLPYLVTGLAATNFGEAWRLAEGKELGDRIVSLIDTLPAAFANPLPSLHPLDILVGISFKVVALSGNRSQSNLRLDQVTADSCDHVQSFRPVR